MADCLHIRCAPYAGCQLLPAAEPGRAATRHSLAVEAHKARAEQQEARAMEAEQRLARFAGYVCDYEDLAEKAARGQRAMDLEGELRTRIEAARRNGERYREHSTQAQVRLGKIRELCESWTDADGRGDLSREMRAESECGRQVLAIIDRTAGSPS